MKTFSRISTIALLAVLAGAPAIAAPADLPAPTTRAEITPDADQPEAMPDLSVNAIWAGIMLIVVAAIFVAAACIGPIVRAEFPQEIPRGHSHDEPPGTSGHHGSGGEINPKPYRKSSRRH